MASTAPAAVIVMAAGQGTRMRSALPKVLHEIGGRSLLGHAVAAAQGVKPEHLVVVVRHQRDEVVAYLAAIAPEVIPADQDEIPGTGRAVACGLAALPETLSGPVVVTSGDVPLLDTATIQALIEQHVSRGDAVTLLTTNLDDPTGYGRVIRADGPGAPARGAAADSARGATSAEGTASASSDPLAVAAVVEHRDATDEQRAVQEINAGVYVFDADYLRATLATLGTDNDQGEVYLTDVVARAWEEGRSTSALSVSDHWLVEGCNDRAQLASLGAELNRRILAGWMAQGVGVTAPNSTWVDVEATLAQDVQLEPGVIVRGRTTIGEGARIGAYSVLTNATVPAGCIVAPHSQLEADSQSSAAAGQGQH